LYWVISTLHLQDKLLALILVYPSFTVPFSTWLLMGFFKTIPQELEDAAQIDGASRLKTLIRVVFPISIPGILTVVIFSFSLVLNEFVYAFTFISSTDHRTVSTGVAGSGFGQAFYGPLRFKGRWLKGDLSIIQWAHFVPAYDVWFDKTWAVQWGQKNDVQVKVDHILNTLLPARMAAESAAGSGHDLFFNLSPPAQFEDKVINHAEIVQEVTRKVGKIGPVARGATYNTKTKKWFAFSDNYVPDPVVWRHDIWNATGLSPNT